MRSFEGWMSLLLLRARLYAHALLLEARLRSSSGWQGVHTDLVQKDRRSGRDEPFGSGPRRLDGSCLALPCPRETQGGRLATAPQGSRRDFPEGEGRDRGFREGETAYVFFLSENPAIFMCKCCNLFSPRQSELLSHVSEKHTEAGVNVDEIIIPLRPLSAPEPAHPSKAGDGTGAGGRVGLHSQMCVAVTIVLICTISNPLILGFCLVPVFCLMGIETWKI